MEGASGGPDATWLKDDEQVLWRGKTARQLRLSVRGALGLVLSALVLAYVAIFLVVSRHGPTFFVAWVGLIVAAAIWQFAGQPVLSWWRRRGSTYVITTRRAVVVQHGQVVSEATTSSLVVVRRFPDRRYGNAFFVDPGAAGRSSRADELANELFGPELPRSFFRSRVSPSVACAFLDVEHLDGLITAARYAGYDLAESPEPTLGVVLGAAIGRPRGGWAAADPSSHGVRGWIVSRLLRRVTRLDSPLTPSVAAERLAADLTRPKTLSFGSGPRLQGYTYQRSSIYHYWFYEGGAYGGRR